MEEVLDLGLAEKVFARAKENLNEKHGNFAATNTVDLEADH